MADIPQPSGATYDDLLAQLNDHLGNLINVHTAQLGASDENQQYPVDPTGQLMGAIYGLPDREG